MSLAASPAAVMSFQRLEDFSSYISCIKCFGKPIIPPLLTKKRRDEISAFKEAAITKEADVLSMKEHLSLSAKVRDIYYRVQERPVSYDEDGFVPNNELSLPGKSALSLNSLNAHLSSFNITSFTDEMHVSMSKIPSSGICSTVHRGVIVCPNEINAGKKYDDSSNIPPKWQLDPSDQKMYPHQFLNSECHLCQIDCQQNFLPSSVDHDESISNEHVCSVSDDEQGGSVMEDTDFESLPTVISAKKLNLQDTDDESNVTCLTQSTDLEKYMDCSIDFSSPDDLAAIANSQASVSQTTLSCRSDDASSETLVNTESELTPCASAMTELSGYSDDAQTGVVEPVSNVSSAETSTSNMHDRAYSVDSYMEILKACTQNSRALPMKKSQSEPSHSEAVQQNGTKRSFSFPANYMMESQNHEIEPKSKTPDDGTQKTEVPVLHPTNVAYYNDTRSISESKLEDSSLHKKTHVRTSSYTLDYPSSALITAHAKCDCDSHETRSTSPHSCILDNKNKIPLNLAFKKEKVNIVLPPTPDRDKLFPILTTTSSSPIDNLNIQNSESSVLPKSSSDSHFLNTNLLTLVNSSKELDIPAENDEVELVEISDKNLNSIIRCPVKSISTKSCDSHNDKFNLNSIEIQREETNSECTDMTLNDNEMKTLPYQTSEEDELVINDQASETSSIVEKEVGNDNIQVFLNQIFKDIQESQKLRVNQLLEEQNKQWLQLQEEFKEQERLLCAKLNLVNIPSVNDHDFSSMPPQHFSDNSSDKGAMEKLPTDHNIRPTMNASSISDTSDKECFTVSEADRENYYYESHILLNDSNNIKELTPSGTSLPNTDEAIAYGDLKLLPYNISLNKSGDRKSNSCGESAPAIDDSVEFYSDRLDVLSSNSQAVTNSNNYPHDSISYTLDYQIDDMQSSSSTKSQRSIDFESEIFTSNPSLTRTNDVPSSLSLSQNSIVYPSKPENLHEKNDYENSNILLQSSYDLPHLIKYFPLPVSSIPSDKVTSNLKRSVPNYEMHEGGCELKQHFVGEREICALSPVSPCICFAVHQQEFNADCPHCHACMNCDTNCLKHANYSKNNFRELNGYTDCEDPTAGKYDNLAQNCNSVCSGLNQGQGVNNEAAKCNSFHSHLIETEACGDKDCLLKGNSDNKKKMHSLQNASDVNMKKVMKMCKINKDQLIRSSGLKSAGTDEVYLSGSSYASHEVRLKNAVVSKSPKKGENQKSKKVPVDVPLLCKADALKKLVSPSLAKRRQSKDVLEMIKDPSIQKKLEKLPALVKGYLTRRLFQTERVQDLIKTLKDTVLIIGKLSEELTSKGNPVSEQDVDFHRQLIVQLMTTFRNVYDIFCTYSIKEQMEIISESRIFQLKRKTSEESKVSSAVSVASSNFVSERSNSSLPPKKSKLSAATVKSLERKRRSTTIDSRTYTIEDFKGCRPRICTKSRVTSPSRIYKSAVDLNLKSKTRGLKTQHWK